MFEGDDFIIAGGSGHVQVLEAKEKQGLERLQESVGDISKEDDRNEPIAIQTQAQDSNHNVRPFLKYLLQAKDLDK